MFVRVPVSSQLRVPVSAFVGSRGSTEGVKSSSGCVLLTETSHVKDQSPSLMAK